jgi:hypothetical protein
MMYHRCARCRSWDGGGYAGRLTAVPSASTANQERRGEVWRPIPDALHGERYQSSSRTPLATRVGRSAIPATALDRPPSPRRGWTFSQTRAQVRLLPGPRSSIKGKRCLCACHRVTRCRAADLLAGLYRAAVWPVTISRGRADTPWSALSGNLHDPARPVPPRHHCARH